MVRRLPFHRDEGLEAGVAPELRADARRARRRNPDSANISVEAESHLEFSAGRRRTSTRIVRTVSVVCRRMAPEVDPVFDGHNGALGGICAIHPLTSNLMSITIDTYRYEEIYPSFKAATDEKEKTARINAAFLNRLADGGVALKGNDPISIADIGSGPATRW